MIFTKNLYNLDTKNKVRQWSISVEELEDGTANIIVLQGLKDGKLSKRKTHITKGKNIGRANETTPVQQAVSEAESKVNKQKDKGYQEEIPTSADAGKNGLGFTKPMLALAREKAKGLDLATYAFQPKLDGFRMLALKQEEGWQLYTRQAKAISVPHIEEALANVRVPAGTTLDGELYCHDLTFQQISSAAKKENENTSKLSYHVYDMVSDRPYGSRYEFLVEHVYRVGAPIMGIPCICARPFQFSDDQDELDQDGLTAMWDRCHSKWVSEGYEGSIARCLEQSYKPNGRDKRMIKRKDFFDKEFEIVGIDRSIKPAPVVGLEAEYPEGSISDGYAKQAQLICVRDLLGERKEFRASMEGGVLLRAKLWAADDSEFVGKLATCKYFEWTDEGLPRHSIARRRDEL